MKISNNSNIEELRILKNRLEQKVKSRDQYLDFNLWYFNHHPFLGTFWTMITLPAETVYRIKNVRDEKKIEKINEILNKQQKRNIVKVKCICKCSK